MRTNHQAVGNCKGFVSVYLAFSSFLLIPMAGLAIDFAVLYSVKARLQTACDAAAIGSGNTLNRGAAMDTVAVNDVALRFFNANYPTGYFGTTAVSYDSTPVQGALGTRTITINATQHVPMLFLRVLGISQSTVAATAQVTVRFVNMILVVDRSGSVNRATFNGVGTPTIVASDLHQFVDPSDGSTSPYFSDGRDNIGMLTFGTSWHLDFPLALNFQSGSPHIGTTIDNIDWGNNSTNTAEGLFHAYRELVKLAQPGALNVIVMLTDGRPSAFSGTFAVNLPGCTDRTAKVGVLTANVGPASNGFFPLPPTTLGNTNGVFKSTFSGNGGDGTVVANNAGCHFAPDASAMNQDITDFPSSVKPPDDNPGNLSFFTTQSTYGDLISFTGEGTHTNDPRALRYASFNVADNVATMIRKDVSINPVIFVIGLNNNNAEEPLDADWLARVANDKDYLDVHGNHVFQAGQAQGKYFDVNAGGISDALRQIASEILRLTK
jgi:Flp pilus assembly protein TadG